MNLLLIGVDQTIKDILVSSLLPKGYPVYSFEYEDDIEGIINKKDINIAFIDVDEKGGLIEHLPTIKKIKNKDVSVIAYTSQSSEDEIKVLIEHGVTAYIQKSNKMADDIKKLIAIIFKDVPKKEKRKALRVKVDEGDEVYVNFSVRHKDQIIKAKVIELSYLGLLFKVNEYADTNYLHAGDTINKLVLLIGNKRALTDIQIVMVKAEYVGVKILDHNDSVKSLIVKYIYEKMSEI